MDNNWGPIIAEELEAVEKLMMDVMNSENIELTEMCNYVISSSGKRIRPAICILAFYASGGKTPDKAIEAGASLEIIHNASLVHDDINDQGEIRRGRRALHKQYSLGKSIVAGDYMYAMGFRLLSRASLSIIDYVVEATAHMGAGEFLQKDFERNINVSESDYMEIIKRKTAVMIECAAKAGAFLANADIRFIDAMGDFAYKLGMAFQIIDDTLDIIGKQSSTGKKVGIDIREGKPTLPIIYSMQDPIYGAELKEIFEKKDITDEEVEMALDLISKTDALTRCIKKAKEMIEGASELLEIFPDSRYKTSLLEMSDYFLSRNR